MMPQDPLNIAYLEGSGIKNHSVCTNLATLQPSHAFMARALVAARLALRMSMELGAIERDELD